MFGRLTTTLFIFGICFCAACGEAGGSTRAIDDTDSAPLHLVETVPAPLEVETEPNITICARRFH